MYDAITANMEDPWKMPTKAQCQELIDNTTNTWTTINGVNGWKFTSKSNSSKYIFLPAAGYWDRSSYTNGGSYGGYWSTIWYSSSTAWDLNFYHNGVNMNNSGYHRYGHSIRGVQ